MATLKAGISNRDQRGFTLFELVVVLGVLGIVAALVIPRIQLRSENDLKRTSRRLAGMIAHLTQESASTKETYRLYFDLESDEYWAAIVVGTGDKVTVREKIYKRRTLPDGILFEDITTPQHGKVMEGEIFTQFFPIGIEPVTIHLKEAEQHWTLEANSLTGRVKVFDRYVE